MTTRGEMQQHLDEEPSHYLFQDSFHYKEGVDDENLPTGTISQRKAIWLIISVNDYMYRYLGLANAHFFDDIAEETFDGSPIVLMAESKSILGKSHPNYWVWVSPQREFNVETTKRNYKYFKTYPEAIKWHQSNKNKGLDSYIRGSEGFGNQSYRNRIARDLFQPDVMYALYVSTHEPLHNKFATDQLIQMAGPTFEEALINYLGMEVFRLFVDEYLGEFAPNNSHNILIRTTAKEYLDDYISKNAFIRLAFFKLQNMYNEKKNVKKRTRIKKEQALLNQIRKIFARWYTDPKRGIAVKNQINNAYLASNFTYSHSILIKNFFETFSIDPKKFIQDKSYRNSVLPQLIQYFQENREKYPVNLDEQWENLSKKMTEEGRARRASKSLEKTVHL